MVERGGLENHCRLCLPGVRIPPPPHVVLATLIMGLAVSSPVLAQYQYIRYEPAVRPPGTQYLVHRTPHFEIIFEAGAEVEALEAARILEGELDRTQSLIGHARELYMPVVLNAFSDRAGGYVHTLPFRQEVETAHIKASRLSAHHTSWMQAVLPHELVHAVQGEADGAFGLGTLVRRIAPDVARSMNLGLPPGLNEGVAVYYESNVHPRAGRLNDARFQMQFYAAVLSERPWSLAQLFEAPVYVWPLGRHYVGGANFYAWQVARDGGRFFRRMRARRWRVPFGLTGFDLARTADTPLKEIRNTFQREAAESAQAAIEGRGPLTDAKVISEGVGVIHRRPQWLTDSTLVVYRSGYDATSGIYEVDIISGESRLLLETHLSEDAYLSLRDSTILFSRYVRDLLVPEKWTAEVFRYDMRMLTTTRLTEGGRVFAPVEGPGVVWGLQTDGQHNRWIEVTSDQTIQVRLPRQRATYLQIAPNPRQSAAAVIVRHDGLQGVYRATWAASGHLELASWVFLPEAAVHEVSWGSYGRYLLFTADVNGVSNVFSHDTNEDRTVQLTNVAFGAFDPVLSPDGKTVVYVDYQHEQYNLVELPFEPEGIAEVHKLQAHEIPPIAPVPEVATDFEVEPYSLHGRLKPRTLLPLLRYTPNGSESNLGFGSGIVLYGADPLRRRTWSVEGLYQSHRLWGRLEVGSALGPARTAVNTYRLPSAKSTLVRVGDGEIVHRIYGLDRRGIEIQMRLPLYLESNVRSTTALLTVSASGEEERWFSLDGEAVPFHANSGQSLERYFGHAAVRTSLYLRYRLLRNRRDLWPRSGVSMSVHTFADVWDELNEPRHGLLFLSALYGALRGGFHTGIRLSGQLLVQNRDGVFHPRFFLPRGFEDAYVGRTFLISTNLEAIQPVWFIENGLVRLPSYFKVLYAYGFLGRVLAVRHNPDLRNARSVGVGLGLQLRVMHYLDMDLRLGFNPLGSDGKQFTFR